MSNKINAKVSTPQTDDDRPVTHEDFCRYLKQQNSYFFIPCREIWPGSSVNAGLPQIPVLDKAGQPKKDKNGKPVSISATQWIDDHKCVEQTTWHPGLPMFITDRLAVAGGWVKKRGTKSFNLYRPPNIKLGDKNKATPWVDHVHKIYPDEADHIIKWLAHHRQHPGVKINHALVLSGEQGIGKDSILHPVKQAIGPWNFQEVSPQTLFATFNEFAKSVILRINEGRDHGEIDRFKFYDHIKIYTATPPDVLRVNEKHVREYYALNCLGVIITTNHKTDGIFLPPDDRRHFVAWSDHHEQDIPQQYWLDLWNYYDNGGCEHVAAYLSELDLSGFNPKAPPPKTPTFWQIVSANTAPEDIDLATVLDRLKEDSPGKEPPDAITIGDLVDKADADVAEWLLDKRNRRSIPHRLDRCGYVSIRNDAKDGLWLVSKRRQVIYVHADLGVEEQRKAARELQNQRQ
jgi:hypothetical protein